MQEDKLQEIYGRHMERIYRLCMLYLKNEQDAQDGVQEIILKLLENNPDFQDLEHERAWIIRTTKNYCKDVLKSSWYKKREDVPFLEEISRQEKMEEDRLINLVLALPPKLKESLYLYYYEEYSVREIAKITGKSESTIQSRLAAGRKKMQRQIEKEEIYGKEYLERCFRTTKPQ